MKVYRAPIAKFSKTRQVRRWRVQAMSEILKWIQIVHPREAE